MYLHATFGGHRSYGNGDINSYINSYMNTSEKAELAFSISHTERFSKLEIPIYYSEVPDKADRKTRTRRTKTIAKCYVFTT